MHDSIGVRATHATRCTCASICISDQNKISRVSGKVNPLKINEKFGPEAHEKSYCAKQNDVLPTF